MRQWILFACLFVLFCRPIDAASMKLPKGLSFLRPTLVEQVLLTWLNGRAHDDPYKAWKLQCYARDELLKSGKRIVGPLIHRMAAGNVMTRIQSIRLIADLGAIEVVDGFRSHLLVAVNPHERLALIQSLGQLRCKSARGDIISFLQKVDDPDARKVAISSLGRTGLSSDAGVLVPYLADDGLVLTVLEALEALPAPNAFPAVMAIVLTDRPQRVRDRALIAAARLGGKRVLPFLTQSWAKGEGSTGLILDAFGATKALGAIPYLLGALRLQLPPERIGKEKRQNDVALAAAVALGMLGQREAIVPLETWIRKSNDRQSRMIGLASLYRLTKDKVYLKTLDDLALHKISSAKHRSVLVHFAGLDEIDARVRVDGGHKSCPVGSPCGHDHGHGTPAWIKHLIDKQLSKFTKRKIKTP